MKVIKVAGIEWATENLKVGDKEYFSFSEAKELCPKGWRVPTASEWMRLYKACDFNFDNATKEGVFIDKATNTELRLPARNDDVDKEKVFEYGSYWASTNCEDVEMNYFLLFSEYGIDPVISVFNTSKMSVRLVKER